MLACKMHACEVHAYEVHAYGRSLGQKVLMTKSPNALPIPSAFNTQHSTYVESIGHEGLN